MERHELELLRRSIAMLTPGQLALNREQALDLLEDLARQQAAASKGTHPSAGR